MADIDAIIDLVMEYKKIKNNPNFNNSYKDEPILRPASKMAGYVPEKIKEMRKITTYFDSYTMSNAVTFYRQGKFMEDYEDEFECNIFFSRYFPTYQSMDNEQLRSYFSWRTKVRNGEIEKNNTSFAYMYIYELINQIGVSTAHEGFDMLTKFYDACEELGMDVTSNKERWLKDYCIYYGLDKSLLDGIEDIEFEQKLSSLLNWKECDNDTLFNAIVGISSYKLLSAKIYKNNPEDVKYVVCEVFRMMSEYYEKNRQKNYMEKLFGRKTGAEYKIFSSAVFYDRNEKQREYEISENHKYYFKNGRWFIEAYFGCRGKNRELGKLIREIDCVMRERYGYKQTIKHSELTKTAQRFIDKSIENLFEHKKEMEKRRIEIDISKLDSIRCSAEKTKEKLIVEDSEIFIEDICDFGKDFSLETEKEQEAICENDEAVNATALNENEYHFMQRLLYGNDCMQYARSEGLMLSVLCDMINEKLFNEFGDSIIVFEGENPILIEDYVDDLKGIIKV